MRVFTQEATLEFDDFDHPLHFRTHIHKEFSFDYPALITGKK
jgi:hypothetical protein